MEDIHSVGAKLQSLVKEIVQGDTETLDDNVDKLLEIVAVLPTLSASQAEHRAIQPQIEQCAVSLWNFAVAKKNGGNLNITLNAKVRHVATNLVFLSNTSSSEVAILKKQIMMALKTARAWIDAKQPKMADNPLKTATQFAQKIREQLSADKPGESTEIKKQKQLEIEKDMLKILSCKAEMYFCGGDHDDAMSNTIAAKDYLNSSSQEAGYLSMLCYNFGVECFQKQNYEQSVNWLRESFEIGKTKNIIGPKNQSRTLRLLANSYLEWDSVQHCQKALNAIGLANSEHSHPAGLYLKIRILMEGKTGDERLKSGLSDIMKHSGLTLDLGLNAVKLLFQNDKKVLGFEGLDQLCERYRDNSKVTLYRLEMFLQAGQHQQAKDLAENIITEHHKGTGLDLPMKKQFHLLVWDQAAKLYEGKQYSEALQWYNYSLSLYTSTEQREHGQAKLHRNRASCLISEGLYEKAAEIISEAEKCDPESPHTHYLVFKLNLLQNNELAAVEALSRMCGCVKASAGSGENNMEVDGETPDPTTVHGLICLAAQMAFEQSNSKVSISALERLVDLSLDPIQVLTALRCLCRLRLTFIAQDASADANKEARSCIMSYVEKANRQLNTLSTDGQLNEANLQNEAVWFMKIAWNMAMQSEDKSEDMQKLFLLCSKLTGYSPEDLGSLMRQKTCLLMSSAASLQAARGTGLDKTGMYHTALQLIDDCHKVCSRIEEFRLNDTETKPQDVTTPLLLVLYEFEARAKLGDGGADRILDKALALPNADSKAFETISALAMDPPLQNRSLAIKALQIVIKKYLQMDSIDYVKCSKAFHSLIELSLQNSTMTELMGKDDAWIYFTHIMDIIEHKAKGAYPEMEILWLMTKAWNCGVHLFSSSHYGDAVRWCEIAMRLLKYLGSLRENYQTQMTSVYGEILAKMDPNRDNAISVVTI